MRCPLVDHKTNAHMFRKESRQEREFNNNEGILEGVLSDNEEAVSQCIVPALLRHNCGNHFVACFQPNTSKIKAGLAT